MHLHYDVHGFEMFADDNQLMQVFPTFLGKILSSSMECCIRHTESFLKTTYVSVSQTCNKLA
jgi:hypothetical protein